MKLFLTSNGFINSPLEKDFLELTENKDILRVAIIPTASDKIEWVPENKGSKKYIAKLIEEAEVSDDEMFKYFNQKGYKVDIVDLKGDKDKIKNRLEQVDIIFVSTGDVNYLLDWVKISELNIYLKDLLESGVLYIGASAGSMIVQPDIGLTWWEPNSPVDKIGLGIVDFITVVHQKEDDERSNKENLIKRKKYMQSLGDYPWTIYFLKDGQAIKVNDDETEHVGLGDKESI
jgi:dipeptidase E